MVPSDDLEIWCTNRSLEPLEEPGYATQVQLGHWVTDSVSV